MKYGYLQRNKFMAIQAKTFDEFIEAIEHDLNRLKRWRESGKVTLSTDGIGDDYATFFTEDAVLAEEEGFNVEDDADYWNDEGDFEEESDD